jgi:hypothetical protein
MLETSEFPVSCDKCGHTELRKPAWLRKNSHPFCPNPDCGRDITAARNAAVQMYQAAESAAQLPRS